MNNKANTFVDMSFYHSLCIRMYLLVIYHYLLMGHHIIRRNTECYNGTKCCFLICCEWFFLIKLQSIKSMNIKKNELREKRIEKKKVEENESTKLDFKIPTDFE